MGHGKQVYIFIVSYIDERNTITIGFTTEANRGNIGDYNRILNLLYPIDSADVRRLEFIFTRECERNKFMISPLVRGHNERRTYTFSCSCSIQVFINQVIKLAEGDGRISKTIMLVPKETQWLGSAF